MDLRPLFGVIERDPLPIKNEINNRYSEDEQTQQCLVKCSNYVHGFAKPLTISLTNGKFSPGTHPSGLSYFTGRDMKMRRGKIFVPVGKTVPY